MHWQRYLRIAQTALIALLLFSTAIWLLLGPPDQATTRAVVHTLDQISQSREVVGELASVIKASEKLKTNAASAEIEAWRLNVSLRAAALSKCQEDLQKHKADWLPVADAEELLRRAKESAQLALERIPAQAVDPRVRAKAGALAVDPSKTGVTDDTVSLLTARGGDLYEASVRLGNRVEQAVHRLSFMSTTWLGLSATTLLWLAICLAFCFSMAVFQVLSWRLRQSPLQALKAQLDMHGRADPHEAFCYTHQLVNELLRHSEQYQTAFAGTEDA